MIIESPVVDIDLWRQSQLWRRTCRVIECEDSTFYVAATPLEDDIEFDHSFINEILNKKYKKLDEYRNEIYGKFWTVQIGLEDWKNCSSCSCPVFLKNYKCKHVVGLALKNKICKIPRRALCIELTKKKAKGRKPKATTALKK